MLVLNLTIMIYFVCFGKTLASGYKQNRKEFAKQSLNTADSHTSGESYSETHSIHHAAIPESEMYSDSLFNPAMVRFTKFFLSYQICFSNVW